MIRTIFVPASGSSSDEAVFATALAAARPLRAHLDFHHIRLTAVEAAARAPHVDFCVGGAVPAALRFIEKDVEGLSELAAAHFKSFCAQQAVEIRDTPVADGVSASYLEEHGPAGHHLMIHARHSDLIVLGRPNRVDYMPSMLLEDLLVGSGRPILIAPQSAPEALTDTVVVGWKETPEAARALGAASPLLDRANKVILLTLVERDAGDISYSSQHLARQLQWRGIKAEVRVLPRGKGDISRQLASEAAQLHATLLVLGGFGHSRLRELVFGGVTAAFLDHADVPVFITY